jgi:hypothetical protein
LAIGIFDVMGIRSAEEDVTMASILNTDVNLDIMPALDHIDRPATPPKAEEPSLLQPSLLQQQEQQPGAGSAGGSVSGFVPFSGRGYRIGDP